MSYLHAKGNGHRSKGMGNQGPSIMAEQVGEAEAAAAASLPGSG